MDTDKTTINTINSADSKYHTLFDSNRDSITIFRLDSEGNPSKFIEANHATTVIFGYSKEELLSLTITDIEKISDEVKQSRLHTILSKGKLDFETIIVDKQGYDRNVEIKTILIDFDDEPAIMNITRDITEKKQIEENSKKDKENLTTILGAIPDLLFEIDLEGKIYYFHAHRHDLLAVLPENIIGNHIQNLLPIDVCNTCMAAITEAQQEGWSMGKQYSLDLPHGTHWFELSASQIKENTTSTPRFIVLARDISERKFAEEKLIANEQLLNQTQVISKIGSYRLDFSTGKWTSSEALNTIFGIDASTEKNFDLWLQILHPEWRSTMTEYFYNEVIANKTPFDKEYKIIKLDSNEECWVHGLGKISFDENGQPLHLIGSIQDINERKIASEKQKISESNYRTLFNTSADCIFIHDIETGIIIDVNDTAITTFGYDSKENIIGQTTFNFNSNIPPFTEENALQYIQKTVAAGNQTFEWLSRHRDGSFFWNEMILKKTEIDGKLRVLAVGRDITERKKAEKAIRKSQEKLTNIFNLANSGIIVADLEGDFLEFNNWWPKMTGYTIEEFQTFKNFSCTHPDDREKSRICLDKIYQGEIDTYQLEKRYIRKDKSIFWGESSVSAIKDKNNKITSTIGIVIDITERKKAEELVKLSEEKYRNLVENSPDGIITYTGDLITYVNSEALRIINATSIEQIIGKSVLDFVHPDSKESIMQRMKDVVLTNDASAIVEEKLISLSGEAVYVELKAIPTLFEHQNAVQVIIHDITERKRTQDKIKQLSQAVEQSPVAIVITNTLGVIEYVNPKFIETTGYSSEEIIGQNPRILKSDSKNDNEYNHLWQTLTSGNEWYGEFHNKKKDGTLYWESASISPIINSHGVTTHYIAIKEDITERKHIEQQLINAKNKAEESDRLKLTFLANMSHEIRTPMNGILGFTELLKDLNLDIDVQQEYIKIIEKSGKRMLNIINDIISISKVESGQIEITTTETNINEQLEYLHTFFTPEAQHNNIILSLNKELSQKDTHIITDREKLYAILTNLIKNAIKFTSEGAIEFGCERKGNSLEFYVRDTGVGISDSQKAIVFERFRQADDTLSRSHEGSGLGLAISKAYVEMLGGKIWVDSQVGHGSTFYFSLPFISQFVPKEKNKIFKIDKYCGENNTVKGLKVLIVEDDTISKLLITIAIKPYSSEILKVSTGLEAIKACSNNPDIDLVMMDINMPEMDGYEATKQIRKINKNVVIIAQTANGMQSDHDKAIDAGCNDYISKPINISSLSNLICKYFKK